MDSPINDGVVPVELGFIPKSGKPEEQDIVIESLGRRDNS